MKTKMIYRGCSIFWMLLCAMWLVNSINQYVFDEYFSLVAAVVLFMIAIINLLKRGKSFFVVFMSNIYTIFSCGLAFILLVFNTELSVALCSVLAAIVNFFCGLITATQYYKIHWGNLLNDNESNRR